MKEIDTDSPVAWPAWCYTGYLSTDNNRQKQSAASAAGTRVGVKTSSARPATSSAAARTLSSFLTSLSSSAASSSSPTSSSLSSASSTSSNCSTEISGNNISGDIVTYKSQTKRKSNSTRNTLHHCAAAAATAAAATVTAPAAITTTRTRKFAAAPESSQFISALLQPQQRSKKSHNHRSLASVASIEKMLSERSLLLSGFNAIESVKRLCDPSTGATTSAIQQQPAAAAATASPNAATATAAAAAAYLYLEKVKNEKLSPRVTAKQIDSVKDAIMESTSTCSSNSNSNNNNNNNSNTSRSSNSINSSNSNNNSNSNVRLQNAVAGNISNHYSPQQPTQHQHLCSSNNVKREQLSPGNNGEIQSMVSRSRSATPSSFRGTPPHNALQTTPPDSLMPVHNLSANLLSSIQQAAAERQNPPAGNSALPTDFSTHNYSEFMRSLAAKYNNSNQNNSSSTSRNALFDSSSSCVTTSSSNKVPSANKGPASAALASKAIAAPPPLLSPPNTVANNPKSQGQHQTHMAAAAAAASVSPFMTSFLSSLPFGQAVFPSLIDMSSTQALITLARAAKEAEIQNILRSTQQNKRPASSASASPRPSLTAALQQAAQFVAPTLFYSTQLQQHSQQTSRQSSPLQARSTSGSGAAVQNCGKAHVPASTPLDLSSQPPVPKRFKAESTSSQGSNEARSTGGGAHLTSRGLSTSSTTVSPLLATNAMDRSTTLIQTASSASSPHETVTNTDSTASTSTTNTTRLGASLRQCPAQSDEVNAWTIDDVCAFVGGIDICLEYVQKFRDQCIDGSGLPLLTEDHLMNSLGMKLGPALKLRSVLAKKLGGPCPCVACVAQAQLLAVQALQTGSITTMAATARAATATLSAPAAAASPVIQPNETPTKTTHLTAGSAALMGNICSGPHAQHRQQTPTTAASTSITATSGSGSTTESSSTSSSSSRSSSTSASSSSSCNNNSSCTNINNSSENRNDTNNNTNSNNSGFIANLVHNSSANNDESSSSKNNNKTLKQQQQQQPGSTDCGS